MKPDPYAPATGSIRVTASGVSDVQCAGTPRTGPAEGFRGLRNTITMSLARPDHRGVDLVATEDAEQIVRGNLVYTGSED